MHTIVYTRQAEETRVFFRDVLEWPSVDAGGGWLIFKAPPAETAVHPTEGDSTQELYLMCDDVHATVADLKAKGVTFTKDISDQGWGLLTEFELPGDGKMGLYEPRHPVAADIGAS